MKRLFLIFLFLLFACPVWATTYYVDKNATGLGNGTSWTNAYTSIATAVAARTSAVTFEISGGTYYEGWTNSASGQTFLGSKAVGHNTPVIIDGTGYAGTYLIQEVGGVGTATYENLTIQNHYNGYASFRHSGSSPVIMTDVTFINCGIPFRTNGGGVFTRIKFIDCYHSASPAGNEINPYGGNTTWNYPQFIRSGVIYITGNGTHVFNNPVFYGVWGRAVRLFSDAPTVVINNPISSGSPVIRTVLISLFERTGGTGTITINHGITQPSPWKPYSINNWGTGVVDGGGNLYASPLFTSRSYPFKIVLAIDDTTNFDAFSNLATDTAAQGMVANWNINTAAIPTQSSWSAIQTYINAGHGISLHGRNHTPLGTLNAFSIQYVGAGSASTMTVGSNTLTTSCTGDAGSNLNIDLTNASYDTVPELCTYIDGLASYTCTYNAQSESVKSIDLADISGQNIKTAIYTPLLDVTKYFDEEVTGAITDVHANIIKDGVAYSPITFVYPYNSISATAQTNLLSRGIKGATGVNSGSYGTVNLPMMNIMRTYVAGSGTTEGVDYDGMAIVCDDNIERYVDSIVELMGAVGGILMIYGHDIQDDSHYCSRASWQRLIAELKRLGVYSTTMEDAVAWLIANGTTSDGGVTYTATFADSLNLHLQAGSPAVNKGVNVGLTTDFEGTEIKGSPEIGAYERTTYVPWKH